MYVFYFFVEKEKPSLNLTISQQYQSSKMSSLKKLLNEKSTSIFLMVCLIFLLYLFHCLSYLSLIRGILLACCVMTPLCFKMSIAFELAGVLQVLFSFQMHLLVTPTWNLSFQISMKILWSTHWTLYIQSWNISSCWPRKSNSLRD